MMTTVKDLLIVTADLDAQNALIGLLARDQSLGTITFQLDGNFEIERHFGRDSGCCQEGASFLRGRHKAFRHAILMFDLHGSGRDNDSPETIEKDIEDELVMNGWKNDHAKVIVIDRELEAWVWSKSPHVANLLGYSSPDWLTEWLEQEKWIEPGQAKPSMPKEALHAALGNKPRATFFHELATKVSFKNCQDRAFNKLLNTLRTWFPARPPEVHP